MVDDHAYIQDERVLERLPEINKLFVQGGLRFLHMYNEDPLCCPARANFLTGQHTLRNKVITNDGDLMNARKTIAVALQRAGYHTYMVGKYLNQYDGPRNVVGWDHITMFYRNYDKLVSLSPERIRNAPEGKPVFAWLSSTAPHKSGNSYHPYVPEKYRGASQCKGISPYKPPTYRVWKSKKPWPKHMPYWPNGWKLRKICESMIPVDKMLGEVVKAQKSRGRSAYYIFMSDNGMAWGQKGYPAKHVPLSTRLPFYVAGPGIQPGSTTSKLTSIIDIAPTIAQIGNAKMPWVDGKSFLPLLKGQSFPGRQCMLEYFWHVKFKWAAVRCKDWHYIRWIYPNGKVKKELYHIKSDPWEKRNLVKKRPVLVRQMNAKLNRKIKNARS